VCVRTPWVKLVEGLKRGIENRSAAERDRKEKVVREAGSAGEVGSLKTLHTRVHRYQRSHGNETGDRTAASIAQTGKTSVLPRGEMVEKKWGLGGGNSQQGPG